MLEANNAQRPIVQLTRTGSKADAARFARLREEFAQRSYAVLPQLLEPELLHYMLKHLARAKFVPKSEGQGEEEFGRILFMPRTEPALFFFHLLCNRPEFFRVVEAITGCPPIGNFFGRIHRSVAGAAHQIDWHGDTADHRLVGFQINLSTEEYAGGLFQLRERCSERLLCEIGNVGLGSGLLFRLGPEVQHRVTLVKRGSRTVGVGWFRAQPAWPAFAAGFFKWPANALIREKQPKESNQDEFDFA